MPIRPCRRFLAFVLLCVPLAVPAQAPPASAPAQPQQAAEPAVVFVPPGDPPVPLLWKVSDADSAVYLLGSFHLLKPDDYPLSTDANRAFADAREVVFELPPAEMASPQLALQMMQAALRSDGTRLDDELPPATRQRLRDWEAANADLLRGMQLGDDRLQLFEPWYVGVLVSLLEMHKGGFDPALGIDQHFIAAAGFAGKPTDGFETGAEQIAVLDGMNRDEQRQFLDEALSDAAAGQQEMEALHAAWRAGDATALWNDMGADMQARYPDLYRHIDVDRNEAWLPKIDAILADPAGGEALVVVGALHLLGPDGLVEKLRAQGYAVERVCAACPAEWLSPPATVPASAGSQVPQPVAPQSGTPG